MSLADKIKKAMEYLNKNRPKDSNTEAESELGYIESLEKRQKAFRTKKRFT